jgi:hypothetical protein
MEDAGEEMAEITVNKQTLTASIRGSGSYLVAEPPGLWLEPFQVVRVTGKISRRYKHSVTRERIPLFRDVLLGRRPVAVQLWRGLLELARAAMEAQGLRVEVSVPPLPPLWRATPYLAGDPALIDFVAQSEHGVIRPDLAKGVDVVSLIAQVVLAFPAARVVVIVPDCARQWQRALRRYVSDVGLSTYEDPYLGDSRVVVATPGALGTVEINRADVVLVAAPLSRMRDDPLLEEVPCPPPEPGTFYKLNQMERLADVRGRLFALVPRALRPSRCEAARLAQVFGTAEYIAAGPGLTERPVEIVWERLTGGPAPRASDAPLQVKQTAAWSNPVLARRAANLARALADDDRDALAAGFPDVARGLQREGGRRVLILVEAPDHAEAVSDKLPGWLVVTADRPALPNGMALSAPGVIATALGAERLKGDGFDALVRLDLGAGLPPLPLPGWLDTTDPDPTPLLVIDFDVRSHPLLRRWARDRRAAYAAAGWRDPAQDPGAAALARFVALTSDQRGRP